MLVFCSLNKVTIWCIRIIDVKRGRHWLSWRNTYGFCPTLTFFSSLLSTRSLTHLICEVACLLPYLSRVKFCFLVKLLQKIGLLARYDLAPFSCLATVCFARLQTWSLLPCFRATQQFPWPSIWYFIWRGFTQFIHFDTFSRFVFTGTYKLKTTVFCCDK